QGRDVVVEVGMRGGRAEARAAGAGVVEALRLAERVGRLHREGAVGVVDRAGGARRDAGAADGGGLTVAERVQRIVGLEPAGCALPLQASAFGSITSWVNIPVPVS